MRRGLLLALLLLATTAMAQEALREGRWRFAETLVLDGLPALPQAPGPRPFEVCLSQARPLPLDAQQERNCRVASLRWEQAQLSYLVSCERLEGGIAESAGKGSYREDGADFSVSTKVMGVGHPMWMRRHLQGVYLGACE